MSNAVFEALADPTRRRILELVASGERTAGELAAEFSTSRRAVSRHLRVLRDAGLVAWRARPSGGCTGSTSHRWPRRWIERTRSNWYDRRDVVD